MQQVIFSFDNQTELNDIDYNVNDYIKALHEIVSYAKKRLTYVKDIELKHDAKKIQTT